MTTNYDNDTQPIIDLAYAAAKPEEIDPSATYVVVTPENGAEVLPPRPDSELKHPRRKAGLSIVRDVDSFKLLFDKHAGAETEVFADINSSKVTAIFDADAPVGDVAGHRAHRLDLALQFTPAWLRWLENDGKMMSQQDFAELIEDRVIDVVDPTGAEMLELAQHFEASSSGQFESAQVLSDGTRRLVFKETVSAKAGQSGQLEIPATFELGVAPYEGGDRFRITARFRYRIRGGQLVLGYKLDRPEDTLRTAFADTVQKVTEAIDRPVALGTPPPIR